MKMPVPFLWPDSMRVPAGPVAVRVICAPVATPVTAIVALAPMGPFGKSSEQTGSAPIELGLTAKKALPVMLFVGPVRSNEMFADPLHGPEVKLARPAHRPKMFGGGEPTPGDVPQAVENMP